MERKHGYGGIDRFRLVAALLIVGIHTFPFTSVSEDLNFFVIHVFARIAVPFFLMITGYFLLPAYLIEKSCDTKALLSFIKKTGLIYVGATIVYFPISIYAGYYSEGNAAAAILRNIVFDGTFYHLWYLPASIIGVLLLYFLRRVLSFRVLLVLSLVLYAFGLLGDSYYGAGSSIPFLKSVFEAVFGISSYTRNGLFYAPVFLIMGTAIAGMEKHMKPIASIIGFVASVSLMMAEGALLRSFGYQRHDSMYIMLLPTMFFLFAFLLTRKGSASGFLRKISMWVYVMHPVCIIAVRGAARLMGLAALFFVENSVIHYIAVCALSLLFSYICVFVISRLRK